MTAAARSVAWFGFYLYAVGLTLILVPNLFLQMLQFPETNDIWIRVVGVLAFNIGYYYHRMGRKNNLEFCRLTISTRIFVFVLFTLFVVMNHVHFMLAAIGGIDLLGALWTWVALQKRSALQNA